MEKLQLTFTRNEVENYNAQMDEISSDIYYIKEQIEIRREQIVSMCEEISNYEYDLRDKEDELTSLREEMFYDAMKEWDMKDKLENKISRLEAQLRELQPKPQEQVQEIDLSKLD